jgi:3-oxoacyl-[acyl-carrier-protein] synthase-3
MAAEPWFDEYMKHTFHGKRLSAIVAVVPEQEKKFEDEFPRYKLSPRKAERMKEMLGLGRHRIAPPEVCSSDLCCAAALHLIDSGKLKRDDIGAIVFVTQTPDYFLPPTSNVLQSRLGLGTDVICLDLNQGCAGALIGIMQAFMLLELPAVKKVLVLAGDTASKQVSTWNRVSYPLVGDAGCALVVERADPTETIHMALKMDGGRHEALIVPAGAYRHPSSLDTLPEIEVEEGVMRSQEQIHMDGGSIFNFTIEDVPPQIAETLAFSGDTHDTIERFFFHQPNRFMLQQMAQKIGVAESKMPNDIVGLYGNCSSVSIPLVICHHDGKDLLAKKKRVCLSGFGVGLTWCTMVMNLGPLDACEIIDYAGAPVK